MWYQEDLTYIIFYPFGHSMNNDDSEGMLTLVTPFNQNNIRRQILNTRHKVQLMGPVFWNPMS